MSYTALYRKFRPLKFSDMVGEEHITKTLRNQIMADRVGHAYLFNGGRGTGKTTSAKILARAVNCLNPKDGEPCNECEICKEILDGSLTDVIEMDAASNNSVDDIREIRDEVNFLPTKAKFRVYIIDEVHMLTPGAFNALLKTLEEPPAHVKFILATTEPQKLPTTILSRCQRFDFKRINNSDIVKRLKIICEESGIEISDESLELISVLSEGAMRDAISILERCSQENLGEIQVDVVKELVGIPNLEYISKIVRSIFEKNEIEALEIIEKVIDDGKDLYNFLWEIIKYLKDILVFKATKKLEIYSNDEIKEIEEISKIVSKDEILNIIYMLSSLENDIKWSSQRKIMFQTGIIKSCSNSKNNEIEELGKRILELEKKLENENVSVPKVIKTIETQNVDIVEAKNINKNNEKAKASSNVGDEVNWNNVLNKLRTTGKIRLFTSLANTKLTQVGDLILEVEFPNGLTPFVKAILNDSTNKRELEQILLEETGKSWHIKYKDNTVSNENAVKNKADNNIEKDLGVNINIID